MCGVYEYRNGVENFKVSDTLVRTTQAARSPAGHLKVLAGANDHQATRNRRHFDNAKVLVVNLMSGPGAGKTSLLEATIHALRGRLSIAVIECDLQIESDARRIRATGAPTAQIIAGDACRLDAAMVHDALRNLDLLPIDVLFIENVGNLVCPAAFDLGQHRNVVLLPVTDGDDSPEKYPAIFRSTDLMAVTKLDLLDAVGDFDPAAAKRHLRGLANAAPVVELSVRSKAGMDAWIHWVVCEVVEGRYFPSANRQTARG